MKYRLTLEKLIMEPSQYKEKVMTEISHTIFEQTIEKDSLNLKSIFDAFNDNNQILIRETE